MGIEVQRNWRFGKSNPNARRLALKHGDDYINSADPWYRLAEGRWRYAKDSGVAVGFETKQELAIYCRSLASTFCPIFGMPLRFHRGQLGPQPDSYSIDRVDREKGYVRGNIQIISVKANRIKNDATAHELRLFAAWVMKNV